MKNEPNIHVINAVLERVESSQRDLSLVVKEINHKLDDEYVKRRDYDELKKEVGTNRNFITKLMLAVSAMSSAVGSAVKSLF